jgi:hypothetical protein
LRRGLRILFLVPTELSTGEADKATPTLTSGQACAIANRTIAVVCKHHRAVKRAFCPREAERVLEFADQLIVEQTSDVPSLTRNSLELLIGSIVELLVKLEGGRPARRRPSDRNPRRPRP